MVHPARGRPARRLAARAVVVGAPRRPPEAAGRAVGRGAGPPAGSRVMPSPRRIIAALALPYIEASFSMSATARPVISAVLAGVNLGRISRSTLSKPSVYLAR